jgi:hypothetical protein
MITLCFDYDVSCGLDGFISNKKGMPTADEAYFHIMDYCLKFKIDPVFALSHIYWYDFAKPRQSVKLTPQYIESKKEETLARWEKIKQQSTIKL